MAAVDEQITKRKVTLTNIVFVGFDDAGKEVFEKRQAVDYVPDDVRDGVNVLDAYLEEARSLDENGAPRWQSVVVSEEFDAGPAGYHGQTVIPAQLAHPLAGQTFEATEPEAKPRAGGGKAGGISTFLSLQTLILSLGLGIASAALIQVAATKNTLASAYAGAATYAALYSTVPGASAGTELTGGAPAYARMALSWSAPSNGVITSTVTFNVASGSTVAGAGVYTAQAGTYSDGTGVTSQTFASQGTYALTLTYTQT